MTLTEAAELFKASDPVLAEREQCCKDICNWCAENIPADRDDKGRWWHRKGDLAGKPYALSQDYLCDAFLIRERVWRESNEQ